MTGPSAETSDQLLAQYTHRALTTRDGLGRAALALDASVRMMVGGVTAGETPDYRPTDPIYPGHESFEIFAHTTPNRAEVLREQMATGWRIGRPLLTLLARAAHLPNMAYFPREVGDFIVAPNPADTPAQQLAT